MITPGTFLGRYEIRAKIGEGGMGEVYRAFDPKLNREVAIKVLPPSFSSNPTRLSRFEQEAQVTGSLNHPNILAAYDVGVHGDSPYVVSELLRGQALRERLAGGQLPQRQAIDFALQIVRGLMAAHERGIVHRDLKPDNIFITQDDHVKILDFGLAKLIERSTDEVAHSDVPTRRLKTDPGVVMGTIGYMSPEQVRGQSVDHRTDIFAFGAVFYEMLSRQRAFHGESDVEILNAILKEEPSELSATNSSIPQALDRIIGHCLEKNPDRRFQSASDIAFALESLATISSGASLAPISSSPGLSRKRERLLWLLGVLVLVPIVILIVVTTLRQNEVKKKSVRFSVVLPENSDVIIDAEEHNIALSPDGQYLAFAALSEGQRSLWIRSLDGLSPQILGETANAFSPFWSPDSRYLAFFADGKLKRIDIAGRSIQTVCDLPADPEATGTWGIDGTIVFGDEDGNVYRVSSGGGAPLILLKGNGDARRWLQFLADGRRFIFYSDGEQGQPRGVYAVELSSSEIRLVAPIQPAYAQYVPGYLLYPREGSLVAQGFDDRQLRLVGEPTVIVNRLPYFDKTGWCEFSASQNGVLAYMSEYPKGQLAWFDRTGKETSQIGARGYYSQVRLAPDGQHAAIRVDDPRVGAGDLWIQDLLRDTRTVFVSGPTDDSQPVWAPDGKRLSYFSCCDDISTLYIKAAGDSGKGMIPIEGRHFIWPMDWSPDGKYIIYHESGDLWVLPLEGETKPYPLTQTPATENAAAISPDGQWVAFVSNETGREEVYVTRLNRPGEKFRISTEGGRNPRWPRHTQDLFYVAGDNRLNFVAIRSGEKFEASTPKPLFRTTQLDYDVSADGQRFLCIAVTTGVEAAPFAVVLNWTADLKQ